MKWNRFLSLLVILISIGFVSIAITTNITYINILPSNSSEITVDRSPHFNVSINGGDFSGLNYSNENSTQCQFMITLSNLSTLGNYTMVNDTFTKYYNLTQTIPVDSNLTDNHTWQVFCNNTTNWLASGIYNFRLNTITPSSITPVNGSVYNNLHPFILNFSVNSQINKNDLGEACFYDFGLTNGTQFSSHYQQGDAALGYQLGNITNYTTTKWYNNTAFSTLIDTKFDNDATIFNETITESYHNMTYKCNNSDGITYSGDTIFFKVDTIDPLIGNETFGVLNVSGASGDNYINSTAQVMDINYADGSVWVKVYYPDGSTTTTVDASFQELKNTSESNSTAIYNASILASTLTQDGRYYFEYNTRDASQRNGTSGTNFSYVVTNLKENKWNHITFTENTTLGEIGRKVANITYVSIYNNFPDWKNFTTYTVGLASNNLTQVNSSLNATLVYANEDRTLIRQYTNVYESTTVELYAGSAGAWNLIGFVDDATLNDTMYGSVYTNATMITTNNTLTLVNGTSLGTLASNPFIVDITQIANTTDILVKNTDYIFNDTSIEMQGNGTYVGGAYNVTYTWTPSYAYASGANITYASYFNATQGIFCSGKRGWSITSCPNVGPVDYTIRHGTAMWIKTNVNITMDRDSI